VNVDEMIRYCEELLRKSSQKENDLTETFRPAPPDGRQWQIFCQWCRDNSTTCADCDRDGWLLLQSYKVTGCVITPPREVALTKGGFNMMDLPGAEQATDHTDFRAKCRHCQKADITLGLEEASYDVPSDTFTGGLRFKELWTGHKGNENPRDYRSPIYGLGVYEDGDDDDVIRPLFEAEWVQEQLGDAEHFRLHAPAVITRLSWALFGKGKDGKHQDKYEILKRALNDLHGQVDDVRSEAETTLTYARDAENAADEAASQSSTARDEASSARSEAQDVFNNIDSVLDKISALKNEHSTEGDN
jgi:hypothetical protein